MSDSGAPRRGSRRAPRAAVAGASELLERHPPVNLSAELGVLGSILLKPDVCDDVLTKVRPEEFFDPAHEKLFRYLVEMYEQGKKMDITLLVDRLQSAGDLDAVGGVAYLGKVTQAVPHAAHATYYADIVREKATFRQLITAATDILRDVYSEGGDPKDVLNRAEERIFSILQRGDTGKVAAFRDVLHQAMDRIDARMRGEHSVGGVETGFEELDKLTGGLHAAELVILAARPSMGKTALALNIAEHVAIKCEVPTLFVSLEMSSIELADRILCSSARVNGHRLRNGTISNEDRRRLVEKASAMSRAPFFVDDSPSRTVTEIAAAARRIKRSEQRLGLIVIDYLQLIEPDNSSDPRQEQVAKIARRLKGLARELQTPVLCLAQVNRQAEDAKEHRPRLSHLRESGAIEQDADVVMFVHRESYFRRDEEKPKAGEEAEVIIAKQRNGPTGTAKLLWHRDFTRFETRAPDRYEEFDAFNSQPAEYNF